NYEAGVLVPNEVVLAFILVTGCSPYWLLTGEGPKYCNDGLARAAEEGAGHDVAAQPAVLSLAGVGGNEPASALKFENNLPQRPTRFSPQPLTNPNRTAPRGDDAFPVFESKLDPLGDSQLEGCARHAVEASPSLQ